MAFFDNFLQQAQAMRKGISEDTLGLEPCPYIYSDDDEQEHYGLFKPYDTSSIGSLLSDAGFQIIINPIFILLGNLALSAMCISQIFVNLYQSAAVPLGFAKEDPDNEEPLSSIPAFILGVGYMIVHTVVDPLWEALAAVTRTLTTLIIGAIAGLSTVLPALSECCSSETNNPSSGSSYTFGQNKLI